MYLYRRNDLLSLIKQIDKKNSPNFLNMEAASFVANFFKDVTNTPEDKDDNVYKTSDFVLVFFCGESRCGQIAKLVVEELKEHRNPKCVVVDVNYQNENDFLKLQKKINKIHDEMLKNLGKKKYVLIDAILGLEDDFDNKKYQPLLSVLKYFPMEDDSFFSISVPSGLDADSGCCAEHTIKAHLTFSFINETLGYYVGNGPEYCGDILPANFEIDDSFLSKEDIPCIPCLELSNIWDIFPHPTRNITANKYDSGCLYLIGGGKGMPGAIKLAAEASLRVGAGLVRVGASSSSLPLIFSGRPEIMLSDLDEESFDTYKDWADALVIGPGLGRTPWAKKVYESCIRSELPKIVDADALYFLAQDHIKLKNAVITPHEKEAARLLNVTVEYLRANRYNCILKLAKETAAIVVLKGHYTMICEGTFVYVCRNGCSAMAVGGMGDVLSGIIGGLLASRFSLFEAAMVGVAIHGKAGEEAAEFGSIGTLPSDLMPSIRTLANGIGIDDEDDDDYDFDDENFSFN